MAGERKGKAYEALVKVALDHLLHASVLTGPIHWNVTPTGMTIEPDFTSGPDQNQPQQLFLVTHSGSAKNSDMKFWRNIGELVEAKARLPNTPVVVSILFDAEAKEALKLAQAAAFDGQVVVGDADYGDVIEEWITANAEHLPSDGPGKVARIRQALASTMQFRKAFERFTSDLGKRVGTCDPVLSRLWLQVRARAGVVPRQARTTAARRGLTKALLLDRMPTRASHAPANPPQWVQALGFMKPGISGPRDADLAWLTASSLSTVDLQDLLATTTPGFQSQLLKVRSVGLIAEFESYLSRNLASLQTELGMLAAIEEQYKDPVAGISLPPGVPGPRNVWMFDIVGAILKAKSGRSQAFGYAAFAAASFPGDGLVGNMELGTWCSCFMNQWFNRRADFTAPAKAVRHCARVLSVAIGNLTGPEIATLTSATRAQFLAKELEATLLSHRGVDPIGFLVRRALGNLPYSEERLVGAFSERAGTSGGAGATSVLRVERTIIKWQSVTDQGRDHKKKELCGRAP
jgi:hypothetical protein